LFDQNKDFQPNAGLVYNDGSKIVSYINKVDANSIYLKYDRIQDIILTLYTNKEKMKPFVNSMLIKELYKSMRTNLLVQEIQTLGEMLCEEGDINIAMLPGNFEGNYYVMDDIAYKMYEKEFLGSIILEKTRDQSIKVKILNGTDVPGLARKMRNNLIKEGLNVVEFGTSSGKSVKESIIINRKGNYSAAKKISELTGIKNIYHVIDNTLLYNILVIIGEDYIK
jgi:CRISPR/Cas system-associated protein Cas7 (RAMP superfamily)